MILFQIDPDGIAIVPFEGNAPGSIDMNCVSRRRMAAQRVKVEAWHIDIRNRPRRVENVQTPNDPGDQVLTHTS